MAPSTEHGKASSNKGLLIVLIILVALAVGYYIYQEQQESGVSLQIGDKEFSATIDDKDLP